MRIIKIKYLIMENPSFASMGFTILDDGEIYIARKISNIFLKRRIKKYFKGLESKYMCNVSVLYFTDTISDINILTHTFDQFISNRKNYLLHKINEYMKWRNEYQNSEQDKFKKLFDYERKRSNLFYNCELKFIDIWN